MVSIKSQFALGKNDDIYTTQTQTHASQGWFRSQNCKYGAHLRIIIDFTIIKTTKKRVSLKNILRSAGKPKIFIVDLVSAVVCWIAKYDAARDSHLLHSKIYVKIRLLSFSAAGEPQVFRFFDHFCIAQKTKKNREFFFRFSLLQIVSKIIQTLGNRQKH